MSAGWHTLPRSRFTTDTRALRLANERIGVLKTPAWPVSPLCNGRYHERAHALVLQTVRLVLRQVELEPDWQTA